MEDNYTLRKKLIESEARFVLFHKELMSKEGNYEVSLVKNRNKAQNVEIKKLLDQKMGLSQYVSKLQHNNTRLSMRVESSRSMSRQLRTLNSEYTEREKLID